MADTQREHYFDLCVSDQADVLQSLAPVMGRRAELLEKDIWLCQVLGILFQLPCRKPMAFKGGTSLFKVYRAIERFPMTSTSPSITAAWLPTPPSWNPSPATASAASCQTH